jgi:hypothetical protein
VRVGFGKRFLGAVSVDMMALLQLRQRESLLTLRGGCGGCVNDFEVGLVHGEHSLCCVDLCISSIDELQRLVLGRKTV